MTSLVRRRMRIAAVLARATMSTRAMMSARATMSTIAAHRELTLLDQTLQRLQQETEKRKGARGRMLPVAQLPAARARIERALTTKGWTQVHGYGARTHPGEQSASDSDGDEVRVRGNGRAADLSSRPASMSAGEGSSAGGGESAAAAPELPYGYKSKYTNSPPKSGAELVGWVVVAYFPSEGEWHDGVVVSQIPTRGRRWYSVFHESENFHEEWEFPDPEIFFRLGTARGGSAKVEVKQSMLPQWF